jgi:DNA polymerase elongation subunit (family B)
MNKVTFQILNIFSQDEARDEEAEFETLQHFVYVFGRTLDGQTVGAKTLFNPYFFIGAPAHWTNPTIESLVHNIKQIPKIKNEIVSIDIVKRKKFYGFTNGRDFTFIRCIFSSKKSLSFLSRRCQEGLEFNGKAQKFEIYEANVDPVLRFMHINDIQACGWVTVPATEAEDTISKCDHDLYIPSFRSFVPCESPGSAPFVTGSFDIEVYSHDDSFPKPQRKENVVFQIATTFQRYGETEPYLRHIVCLGETDPIEGVEMVVCKTEAEALISWTKICNREQVDVLLGYNILGFDWKYMYERAKINMCVDAFGRFSKLADYSCPLVTKTFSSGAYGTTEHQLPTTPGIFQIDLLVVMRREFKLDSYKLDSVAEHFLNENKLDVSPKEIFAGYRGDSASRCKIAKYCVQDVELPLRLVNKLVIFTNLVEMANVTYVPIDYLILRGQQIKCFSQILRETRKRNMVVKTLDRGGSDGKFEGAVVLKADKGYYKQGIICLDFSGLYPSLLRAYKMCHSNWVNSKEYMNLPGVEYWSMEWHDEENEFHKHTFAQNEDGVLPYILEELGKSRTKAKKDMKNAKTAFEKSIHDARQKAFKISANSIYGFCGASNGFLPCRAISESTTASGRACITESKEFVEKNYAPSHVVYGDSVTGDTPLLLRRNGVPFISRIDNIVPEFYAYGEKEISPCEDLEVWNDSGFTKIRNVIRHKTDKQMFRIITGSGIVDVTEDHSLLLESGEKISPKDVQIGTRLLHNTTSVAFKVCSSVNATGYWMEMFMKENKLPSSILSASIPILQSFWDELKNMGGDSGTIFLKGKEVTTTICAIADRLGIIYNIDVGIFEGEYCVFYRDVSVDTRVRKIIPLGPCNDYVYDLTTKNSHFHVGPGHLIVHNTDSIMFDASSYIEQVLHQDPSKIDNHIQLAVEIAARATKELFRPPIELCPEKVMRPFILCGKKRYCSLLFPVDDPENPYVDMKGIQAKRKDSTLLVRDATEKILHTLLYEIDVLKARTIARNIVQDLLGGKVPMEKLVLSKSLRESYANENLPHVMVAKKREERNPGLRLRSPERIPFVYILNDRSKSCEKAECPEYVREHNLPIDYYYYFTNSLKNPLESFFEVVSPDDYEKMYDDIVRRYQNKKNKQVEITNFFQVSK